jgi:glycosyltransferase involved in cell wall biosynthesis
MDVLCLTSRWEGLPFVLLEAMAASRPVVATDVDGVREGVVDHVTGRLVPPGDPARVAEATLAILAEPDAARRMGAAGRARLEQRFTLTATVEGHARLYERLYRWTEGRRAPDVLSARPHPGHLLGDAA